MLRSFFLWLMTLLATTLTASAYGALAIGGNTAEAATKGIAVGVAYNYGTKDGANAAALERCLAFTDAPAETVARCKLVESFSGEWIVITLDPGPSTPGFGWSIDMDKLTAERNAMDQCKASSPEERKAFCEVAEEADDTNVNAPN